MYFVSTLIDNESIRISLVGIISYHVSDSGINSTITFKGYEHEVIAVWTYDNKSDWQRDVRHVKEVCRSSN